MTALDVPLSRDEEQRLADCESRIRSGLRTFVEVGKALAEIRDSQLYRQTHETFAAYCEMDWQLSRKRAYDLIGAAETVEALSPIGDTPIPATESQARELSGLEPVTAATVMQTAAAAPGKITAERIREARQVIAPKPTPVAVEPEPVELPAELVAAIIPPGFTAVNPAKVAAEAMRDARTEPAYVLMRQVLPEISRWGAWVNLPAVGGPAGVVASLHSNPTPSMVADDIALVLRGLDNAIQWIDVLRSEIRASSARQLRSVQ